MDLEYFVLRIEERPGGRPAGLESFIPAGVLEDVEPAKVSIETVSDPRDAEDARRDARNKAVGLVMPVSLVAPFALPEGGADDPVAEAIAAKLSWGIAAVDADKSQWSGAGVTVAVLDTGIDSTHPAFPPGDVELISKNFTGVGAEADVTDANGHGTHCAGTIFGRDVSGVRIGIARGVKRALIGKVLNDSGGGSAKSVLDGLLWARGQNANVISMSLGFDFPKMQANLVQSGRPAQLATSMALRAYRDNLHAFERVIELLSLETADSLGAVVVAASGNESRRDLDPNFVIDVTLPAATANILSTGALMRKAAAYSIAPFSNMNPVLSAPGSGIVSARIGGGLCAKSGTSMACPHVAGVAALWWQKIRAEDEIAHAGLVRAKLSAIVKDLEGVMAIDRGAGMVRAP